MAKAKDKRCSSSYSAFGKYSLLPEPSAVLTPMPRPLNILKQTAAVGTCVWIAVFGSRRSIFMNSGHVLLSSYSLVDCISCEALRSTLPCLVSAGLPGSSPRQGIRHGARGRCTAGVEAPRSCAEVASGETGIAQPDVRAKRATTVGRQARAVENAAHTARAWWPAVGAPLDRGVRPHVCHELSSQRSRKEVARTSEDALPKMEEGPPG